MGRFKGRAEEERDGDVNAGDMAEESLPQQRGSIGEDRVAALLPKRRWTWRWRAHGGGNPMAAGSGSHPFADTWVEPGVAKPSSGKIESGVAFRGGGQIRGAAAVAVTCSGGREEDGGCELCFRTRD